ncbi:MAG TPA: hypothetical protein PLW30_03970 [Candidatus Saccharicenans sp.]|nr:hypothetical protein [Candidatus Saccharicenans sp.]HUM34666.1 hypothetical protein [Candidatus Saccharicenans sp.]
MKRPGKSLGLALSARARTVGHQESDPVPEETEVALSSESSPCY